MQAELFQEAKVLWEVSPMVKWELRAAKARQVLRPLVVMDTLDNLLVVVLEQWEGTAEEVVKPQEQKELRATFRKVVLELTVVKALPESILLAMTDRLGRLSPVRREQLEVRAEGAEISPERKEPRVMSQMVTLERKVMKVRLELTILVRTGKLGMLSEVQVEQMEAMVGEGVKPQELTVKAEVMRMVRLAAPVLLKWVVLEL